MSSLSEKMKKANLPDSDPAKEIAAVADNRVNEEETYENTERMSQGKNQTNSQAAKKTPQTSTKKTKTVESTPEAPYANMPYKAVSLIPEFHRFLRVRPKQLGYVKESYLEMIIMEEIEYVKKIPERDLEQHYARIYAMCNKRYRDVKEKSAVKMSQKALDFITEETINSGVSFTAYMNYLMEKEVKREREQGKRPKK